MKKIVLSMVAIVTFVLGAYAGTTAQCKISGSSDQATVVATITEVGDGYVKVALENDGTFNVNVNVRVSGHSCLGDAAPQVKVSQTCYITVPVSCAKSSHKVSDYNVSVSGARCK